MALSSEEVNAIAERTAVLMMESKRAQWVDPETHAEHHNWVKDRMSSDEEWRQLKRRIIAGTCIWAVPIILMFVFNALWRDIVAFIKR